MTKCACVVALDVETGTDNMTDGNKLVHIDIRIIDATNGYRRNKITFKRTRSMSNAVSFKRGNNVCACAVNATVNGFSDIDFIIM